MRILRKKERFISLLLSVLILFISCEPSTDALTSSEDDVSVENNSMFNQRLNNPNGFSGEELFKSIYFGYGEFAENIRQLNRISEINNQISVEERDVFDRKIRQLVDQINETNPGFFSEFRTNISSSDHRLIQLWINRGSYELERNLAIVFPEIGIVTEKIKKDLDKGVFDSDSYESIDEYESALTRHFENNGFDDLLGNNMITGEDAFVAFPVWAVAFAVYFVIVVHNAVAVTALIYFKVAFWGPGLDSVRGSSEVMGELNTEVLINEISEYYANN